MAVQVFRLRLPTMAISLVVLLMLSLGSAAYGAMIEGTEHAFLKTNDLEWSQSTRVTGQIGSYHLPLPARENSLDLASVSGLRFLLSVNTTWEPCIKTIATPWIKPNVSRANSTTFSVGDCDYGELTYQLVKSSKVPGAIDIQLVWYSNDVLDASPPACTITWSGDYLVPTVDNTDGSLLPGCWVGDSREGMNMTYFWFYVLEWQSATPAAPAATASVPAAKPAARSL